MPTVFLLSPAYCGGRRAGILLNPASEAATVREFRSGRMTLGRAFAFMSGLYFRGKLSYAERFGEALVITPTRGLQPTSLPFTLGLLREFAVGDVSLDNPGYRSALERDVQALAQRLGARSQVVLLGSVASGKYVDVLLPILGARLRYPSAFIGRGDMSRGGLMLRSVASGVELEYEALIAGVRPRGPRPPKLDPLTRVAVSLEDESNGLRGGADRGIVEPSLSSSRRGSGRSGAGTPGAERLGAVVDCRLRPRSGVHRRPRS
ncbi:MAG TPA: hypothetical protein VFS49_00545 [Croceibacterium sp.]|nr:hypothetical protein [Croceibacterium sp.]